MGDEVVTIGGIHGVVNHIEDDVVHLEVDDDVVVKIALGAVSTEGRGARLCLARREATRWVPRALTGGGGGGARRLRCGGCVMHPTPATAIERDGLEAAAAVRTASETT